MTDIHDVSSSPVSFADLQLSSLMLETIEERLGFKHPSPIQQKIIPFVLQGRDVIGQAQTGTGKTAAFAIPTIERLDDGLSSPQVLVLAPTRELAIQVASHYEALSVHHRKIRVVVLCGGQDYRPQLKSLKDGAQVVVGTPGRILDHLNRKTLTLDALKTLVLDEADEMLRMGFIEDVETILESIPNQKQIALFSATMPPRIRQIANRYLQDPVSIEIKAETATVKAVEQRFLFASSGQKKDVLLRILAVEPAQGTIVFTRTKLATDEVTTLLQHHGYRAMAIHGDITQATRERVITQFKQGVIDILVATDVAARGLDVDRVTHVINYDMAHDPETYVHRIGRTGRAGRSGVAILFVSPKESRLLTLLERHTRQRIQKISVPTDEMIQAVRQQRFLERITHRLEHEHLKGYQEILSAYIHEENRSLLDISAALALMLHQDKPWKSNLPAVEPAKEKSMSLKKRRDEDARGFKDRAGPRRSGGRQQQAQEVYRLNVGRLHGVKPGNIVGAIANEAGLESREITGLKINEDHSTVRLPAGLSKQVLHNLTKARVCGRQLQVTSLGIG